MMRINRPVIYVLVILAALAVGLLPKLNAFYFFALLAALLIFIVYKKAALGDRRFLVSMIIVIFISRFLFSLLVMSARGAGLSQDEGLYSKKALLVTYQMIGKKSLERYFFEFFDEDTDMLEKGYGFNSYTYLTGVFYRVFGYQIQAARLINMFYFMIAFLIFFYMARTLFDAEVARLSSVIFAFFPSTTLWSVAIGVDTVVMLGVLAYIYSLVKMVKKFHFKWLMLAIAALMVVKSIRPYIFNTLILVALTAVLCIFLARLIGRGRVVMPAIALALSVVFVLFIGLSSCPVVKDRFGKITAKLIKNQGSFVVTDEGGYTIYPERCYKNLSGNLPDFAAAYARGMSYVLFSPFPWRIESKLQLFAYPQVILWYFMLFFAPYGFYLAYEANRVNNILILVYSFLVLSMFALAAGNVGAVFRHRDMVAPFVIIYFSAGARSLYLASFEKERVKI